MAALACAQLEPGVPVLGVLGGMGPAATADFLTKLVQATPAERDAHHIPVLLRSFPQIPDRSAAIVHGQQSPLPHLLLGVQFLAASGVSAIAIPCNAAHYWHSELQAAVTVPVLHIAEAIERALRRRDAFNGPVAVFGTEGTVRAHIFDERLIGSGYELLPLLEQEVSALGSAIRETKAGRLDMADGFLRVAAASVAGRGALTIVLACTELPLLPSAADPGLFLDATGALAEFCVARMHCTAEERATLA
jgi:aspartate racemase